jgi:mannose-6-phosphate isomerase-like protein (cupin superfamily)
VGEDTDGQYTLVEVRVDPQIGPPPHIHHREDEAFYIRKRCVLGLKRLDFS